MVRLCECTNLAGFKLRGVGGWGRCEPLLGRLAWRGRVPSGCATDALHHYSATRGRPACRSAAATPDVIEQKGALCALVTAQQGRIQEWLSGCGQQYALLAGSQADSPVRGSSGGGPARRLRAGEMAATGPVVKQRQLQQLLAENEHVQSNELRLQHGHEKLVDLQSGDVFSHFQWDDPCDSSAVISAPIEPLIGHFRYAIARARLIAAAARGHGQLNMAGVPTDASLGSA